MALQCPKCSLICPERTEACDCGHEFLTAKFADKPRVVAPSVSSKAPTMVRVSESRPLVPLGVILLVIGLIASVIGYFSPISAPGTDINSGMAIGRMVDVLGGLLTAILGAVLMLFRKPGD